MCRLILKLWCVCCLSDFSCFREERRMNGGMTGASSNIGCLEALPVQALQQAQSALKALNSVRLCTRGCKPWRTLCIQRKIQRCNMLWCIRGGGGSIWSRSMFCCFTQWATSQGLSWHMSLRLHSIYHREAPATSTFSTMKILGLSSNYNQSCKMSWISQKYPHKY